MRTPRRNSKTFRTQIAAPPRKSTPASDEDPFANEIDERFLLQRAFEQFECFAHPQMNDGVQGLAFDFLAREAGIIFQNHRLPGQTIAQNDAAFIEL